jgi:hypothetical protein
MSFSHVFSDKHLGYSEHPFNSYPAGYPNTSIFGETALNFMEPPVHLKYIPQIIWSCWLKVHMASQEMVVVMAQMIEIHFYMPGSTLNPLMMKAQEILL